MNIVTDKRCNIDAVNRDNLWRFCRIGQMEESQKCPSWTGFNSLVTSVDLPITTVRYLPFLNSPPSDLDTIYSMLLRLVKIAAKVGQSHIMVTADMAIYSKAQQILWAKPPKLDGKVTMRIGGMHMTMALMASLGNLYGAGGLLSILADSTLFSEATANQILQGKQYSRGLRGIKIVHEALYRILFQAMERWLLDKGQTFKVSILQTFRKRCKHCACQLTTRIQRRHKKSPMI